MAAGGTAYCRRMDRIINLWKAAESGGYDNSHLFFHHMHGVQQENAPFFAPTPMGSRHPFRKYAGVVYLIFDAPTYVTKKTVFGFISALSSRPSFQDCIIIAPRYVCMFMCSCLSIYLSISLHLLRANSLKATNITLTPNEGRSPVRKANTYTCGKKKPPLPQDFFLLAFGMSLSSSRLFRRGIPAFGTFLFRLFGLRQKKEKKKKGIDGGRESSAKWGGLKISST